MSNHVLTIHSTLKVAQTDEQDDVRSLLRMMQENPENTELKLDILDCLSELFLSFPPSQHRFQVIITLNLLDLPLIFLLLIQNVKL